METRVLMATVALTVLTGCSFLPKGLSVSKRFTAGQVPLLVDETWVDTHGEQCHVKTLYAEHTDRTATLLLGSANYTRRNLDNFNAECDLACTAPLDHSIMKRARETFDRWWSNPDGQTFTADDQTYEDTSLWRKIRARAMEATGLSSF